MKKRNKKKFIWYSSLWEFLWCFVLVVLFILAVGSVESMANWLFNILGV